jgi:hypothetical protein
MLRRLMLDHAVNNNLLNAGYRVLHVYFELGQDIGHNANISSRIVAPHLL